MFAKLRHIVAGAPLPPPRVGSMLAPPRPLAPPTRKVSPPPPPARRQVPPPPGAARTKDGKVKHSPQCYSDNGGDFDDPFNYPADFRRCGRNPTPGCPRCAELASGAKGRDGLY